jgi:hypothetical protein
MSTTTTETNLSEEEYLKKHIESLETNKKVNKPNVQTQPEITIDNSKSNDLHYFAFDVKQFPCGIFYPAGATIQVRSAQVREIQAYSMVDDNNFYDIVEKMNDMLSSCVRVKYLDGTVGSYMEIRDPDRYYLIFLIRELTFQKGTSLTTTAVCPCGQEEVQIELKIENFKLFQQAERILSFFDPVSHSFRFEVKNGKVFNLAPPTIGLQKSFTEYIVKENSEKKKPNLSFLKIIPFLLHDRTSITIEGIKSKLEEFQKMDDISFQFLNSAVEKMTFGIEKLQKKCSCGLESHTDMIFPDGPSAIFVVHDAFEQFIKE